ncbi:penicillin acylase family protein [Streptomyces sp. NPDC020965]|uniref:penicillin acylase family protein n=1 Tax=Streptomyces sp. NPDC020965 TaxID=3365105 RepID=UPI0037AAAFF0
MSAVVAVQPTAIAADKSTGERGGELKAGGHSATIRYTEYGIPHITADNYPNLGFGSGWAQAADQVCILANGFVTVRAERSRWFGPDGPSDEDLSSARNNLSSDLYFRGVRDAGTARKLLAAPYPVGPGKDAKAMLHGWVAGYNAWLAQNKIKDPACRGKAWVRPITVNDLATVGHSLTVTGGTGQATDGVIDAAPPTPARSTSTAARPAQPPAAAARAAESLFDRVKKMGSNAVAFNGSTTANGRGLLLGNPHYPWQGARRFWQSQQTIPGELNVAGAALLASPAINIGYNSRVAWSHTVSTGVTVALRRLTLDPTDPTVYLVDGERRRMTKRTVTVEVKGGAPVTRDQWWTPYGPVVTAMGGLQLPWTTAHAYALGDPNAFHLRIWDTALAFGKARDVAGVREGLARTQGLPWLNTIAADSRGGSLYTQSQVLPRITNGLAQRCSTDLGRVLYPRSGLAVLDASRAECGLGKDPDAFQPGIFGPKKMPTLRNAPYATNSNDSPWLAHPDRPLTGYERVFGDIDTARSLRTRGGAEDLSAMARRGGLKVEDAQRLQFANRVPAGDLAAADAARACAALPGGRAVATDGTTVDVSAACPVLRRWDRTVDTASRGALLFERFWSRLVDTVPERDLWKVPFSAADPVRTPHTFNTADPRVARALADTVQELRKTGTAPDAAWGRHHYVERGGSRIPVSGGPDALGIWNMMESDWDAGLGAYPETYHGSSYIQAVSWNSTGCPVARTLLTYGQSSDPGSPHAADQTRLFSKEKWVTPRFCEKEITASPALKVLKVRERR